MRNALEHGAGSRRGLIQLTFGPYDMVPGQFKTMKRRRRQSQWPRNGPPIHGVNRATVHRRLVEVHAGPAQAQSSIAACRCLLNLPFLQSHEYKQYKPKEIARVGSRIILLREGLKQLIDSQPDLSLC